jgi:excisionase family DNA binding protein
MAKSFLRATTDPTSQASAFDRRRPIRKTRDAALLPVHAEVSTQQAADLLKVSRPFLIGLLEARKIPCRLVGQHRRVRLDDLLAYKHKDDVDRRRVADHLTADAQELGMGY